MKERAKKKERKKERKKEGKKAVCCCRILKLQPPGLVDVLGLLKESSEVNKMFIWSRGSLRASGRPICLEGTELRG